MSSMEMNMGGTLQTAKDNAGTQTAKSLLAKARIRWAGIVRAIFKNTAEGTAMQNSILVNRYEQTSKLPFSHLQWH